MERVSLTVDIPGQSPVAHDPMDRPDTPGYFNSKNENSYSFTRNGSQYIASPSSPASPMMTPVLPYKGMDIKRVSEYEFPTAVKVDSLYQSYLNHPFNQQIKNNDAKTSPRLQKPQAFVNTNINNKYSNYTKNSKNIKLITIKDTKDKMGMTTMDLGSPTSLVSPPPPYIHSSGHGVGFDDSKETSTTATTVARPKLARVLPPQAIPIITSSSPTFGPSSADAKLLSATPTSVAMGGLIERSETETLYNLQMADDVSSSSPRTSTREPMVSVLGSPMQASFPSFWEDSRQQKMHWVFLSFGCVLLGSAIWVIAMQVFVEWVMVMPAATVVLCALQFGRYRWRKNRFNKQKKLQESDLANQYVEAAASLAQRSQGDRREMAFLEPHQPISYDEAHQHHVSFKQPSQVNPLLQHPTITGPTSGGGGFSQQSYKQPRQQLSKKQLSPKMPMTVNPALYRPSANHGQFLSPVDSPQTPPPAYFLKKIELPEINGVGDLVSEFEIDFSSIKY
ncbi:hypothetical protein BG005_001647 [Podila minutissima]|nr:hypothetical protein BG005_001647 [Podila minutissima]